MPDNLFTRDDVVVTGTPRRLRIPFLLRVQITTVRVGGRDYEITSVKTPIGSATAARIANGTLAMLNSADTEKAIDALLDALNDPDGETS